MIRLRRGSVFAGLSEATEHYCEALELLSIKVEGLTYQSRMTSLARNMFSAPKIGSVMNGYRPCAGSHAIDQAVVGIRLRTAANDERFHSAAELATELAVRYNLPGRLQLDPFSMVFGRQVISQGYATSGELSPGLVFQRVNPDGSMGEELTLERNTVTYRTRSYRRWSDVIGFISGILCPVAAVLSGESSEEIAVIELRCMDQFLSDGQNPPLGELIRRDTPYIPPDLFARSDMLHCHLGWFEDVSETGRTLVNLNLDVSDIPEGARVASLLQVVSKQFSGAGNPFAGANGFDESVLNTFNVLHRYDKNLLASLITDELQEQISLRGNSGTEKPC